MTTTPTTIPSAVVELVGALGGTPQDESVLAGLTPDELVDVVSAARSVALIHAERALADRRPTMPPVECKAWCLYGDGHPGEWHTDDQWCASHGRFLSSSLLPEEEWTDGSMKRPTIEVYGQQAPGQDPRVEVGLNGGTLLILTTAEARSLAAFLVETADIVDGAR